MDFNVPVLIVMSRLLLVNFDIKDQNGNTTLIICNNSDSGYTERQTKINTIFVKFTADNPFADHQFHAKEINVGSITPALKC